MQTPKIIVTVAPTGGMASKKQNPNLPTQPEEIAESVYRSYNEGASIVAVHARRPDDQATCSPEGYGRINNPIRERCDIVMITASARCTEMAELFKKRGAKPEWEVFSLAHIMQDTTRLIEAGFDKPPYYINMVLNANGFQGGYAYSPKILQLMVDYLPRNSIFNVSAIGTGQLPATEIGRASRRGR